MTTDLDIYRAAKLYIDQHGIRCDRCSRVGRYKRRMLIDRYGADSAMPDVLNEITACERNARLSVDRCRAYFEELRACASGHF